MFRLFTCKSFLLAICACLLPAATAMADDVLWFGAVDTMPGQERNIPPELHDLSLQAGEIFQAPVSTIASKKRKIIAGTEGVFRLETGHEPSLAFEVIGREESAYLVRIRFLLGTRVVFEADLRIARNQPLYFLPPDETTPGIAGFFILLR
jgi:hypothetical protein